MTTPVESRMRLLEQLLSERILVLDGAMGTTVFSLGMKEESIRGERFKSHHKDLKNFVDIGEQGNWAVVRDKKFRVLFKDRNCLSNSEEGRELASSE